MRLRPPFGCAIVCVASALAVGEDAFEPNPSLGRLSADAAYDEMSAQSLAAADCDVWGAIRIDAAGRLLVVGGRDGTMSGPRVLRLDADGRLDPAFGGDGVVEIPVAWWDPYQVTRFGLEVDAAGRIVVTGSFRAPGTYPFDYDGPQYAAARLLEDGALDPEFSGDGLLEIDRSAGLAFLGPFRASGTDGSMLALAAKDGPDRRTLVGLVRIGADGAIDAGYGDGFAPVADGVRSSTPDFAVDAAGRAVVAAQHVAGFGDGFTVRRYDAVGRPDPSFGSADGVTLPRASSIALDGMERIVGLDGGRLMRRLPDGAPDPSFSGDGFAWTTDAAGFQGGVYGYEYLYWFERRDPDFDPQYETGLLAVATRADRWVLAKSGRIYDAPGRALRGVRVECIDPADPGAIRRTVLRSPPARSVGLRDLAVDPDGTLAYLLGPSSVARVDLTAEEPEPLPDLGVRFLGIPRAVDLGGGRYRVTARVRIRNTSRRDVVQAYGRVGFELFSGLTPPEVPSRWVAGTWRPFRVRARSSVVKRFRWEGGSPATSLASARLSVSVSCELPDQESGDNAAISPPTTPVYMPR